MDLRNSPRTWIFAAPLMCTTASCGQDTTNTVDTSDMAESTTSASNGTDTDDPTEDATTVGPDDSAVLQDNVYILSNVDDIEVFQDRLIFPLVAHEDLALRVPGDILFADRGQLDGTNPDGFVRRVTHVAVGDVSIEVQTQQAYLTDVFRKANLDFTSQGPPWNARRHLADPAGLGGSLAGTAPFSVVFSGLELGEIKIKPKEPLIGQIKGVAIDIAPSLTLTARVFDGALAFAPQTKIGIAIDKGLEAFSWVVEGEMASRLIVDFEVTVESAGTAQLAGATEGEKANINDAIAKWLMGDTSALPDLKKDALAKPLYLTGSIPVPNIPGLQIPYSLSFDLGLECAIGQLKGSATLRGGIDGAGSLTMGSKWESGLGWSLIEGYTWEETAERSLTNSFSATAGCSVTPTVELIIAGVAGPNAHASAKATLKLDAMQACMPEHESPLTTITAGLTSEVSIGVGARLGLVVPFIDIDKTLLEANWDHTLHTKDFGPWGLYQGYPELLQGFSFCEACGDGVCGDTEDCLTCAQDCLCSCGDGIVQIEAGEYCDDGNDDNLDKCTNTCLTAACGDGFVQGVLGEQCDDGNDDDIDQCNNSCQPNTCGNGALSPGEACDDGNVMDDDGCDSNCQFTVDDCGVVADGIWLQIDYSGAVDPAAPAYKVSLSGGWSIFDWAPQGKILPYTSAIGDVTIGGGSVLLNAADERLRVYLGLAGLSDYAYATACITGSGASFRVENALTACGADGGVQGVTSLDLTDCFVPGGAFQALEVRTANAALAFQRLRLTLHGAIY